MDSGNKGKSADMLCIKKELNISFDNWKILQLYYKYLF